MRSPAVPARAVIAVLLCALVVLAPGCAQTVPSAVGSRAPTQKLPPLTVWLGPVGPLHPHVVNPHLHTALYTPLVASDPVNRLPAWGDEAPHALVETITTDDAQVWTVTLRAGRRWHDGTPITAADVVRGWQRSIEVGTPVTSTIRTVGAVDDRQVVVELDAPFGPFPSLLVAQAFSPVHADAPAPDDAAGVPQSSGPLGVVGVVDLPADVGGGQAIALEARGGNRAADVLSERRVHVQTGPAPTVATDLAIGEDGQLTAPPGEGTGRRTGSLRLPGRQLAYLGLPLTDPAYADPAVREALALALDVEALAGRFGTAVTPAERLIGPGLARQADVACAVCRFDPDAARAAWPDDAPGTVDLVFAADAGHEPVMEEIAASWRSVLGVDVLQRTRPADVLVDAIRRTDVTGPFRLTWAADLASPVRLLDPLFGPRGLANDSRYRSDAVADLLTDAAGVVEPAAQLTAYGRAEAQVLADLPVIPLWFSTVPITHVPELTDVAADGEGRLEWTSLRR